MPIISRLSNGNLADNRCTSNYHYYVPVIYIRNSRVVSGEVCSCKYLLCERINLILFPSLVWLCLCLSVGMCCLQCHLICLCNIDGAPVTVPAIDC